MAQRPMWVRFLNRVVNPVVARILRSRAHRLLSGHLALLEIPSRRSDGTVEVPVIYKARGHDLFRVDVGAPDAKRWWRMLRGPGPLRIWLDGEPHDAAGVVVEQEGRVSVVIHLEADWRARRHEGRHHRQGEHGHTVGRVR
jgi:hypothetical protein